MKKIELWENYLGLFFPAVQSSCDLHWGRRMVFASIREHAEHCDFFASTSRNKRICFASLRATQKFGEHEQASTRLNFASKSRKGKILRAVKNFNGPFITPSIVELKEKYYHFFSCPTVSIICIPSRLFCAM